MPKWYNDAEEKIKGIIRDIANENNINFSAVWDSFNIENSVQNILSHLVWISENVKPEISEKDFGFCKHCKLPISRRNPSGLCDHLYYPESCKICEENDKNKKA